MNLKKKVMVIVVVGFALVVAIGLQLMPGRAPLPGKGKHLTDMLPTTVSGWESRLVPLGQSEAGTEKVEEVLRFDDACFREYYHGGVSGFSVYIAYWNPGKMPVQLVASHTPDQCWVEAGWTSVEANHRVSLGGSKAKLRPAQGRVFRDAHGLVQHVLFWHLIGNKLYDYGTRVSIVPSPWNWWRDVALGAVVVPREQYFIRLTSARPFEELKGDPGWDEMLSALSRLGLGETKV